MRPERMRQSSHTTVEHTKLVQIKHVGTRPSFAPSGTLASVTGRNQHVYQSTRTLKMRNRFRVMCCTSFSNHVRGKRTTDWGDIMAKMAPRTEPKDTFHPNTFDSELVRTPREDELVSQRQHGKEERSPRSIRRLHVIQQRTACDIPSPQYITRRYPGQDATVKRAKRHESRKLALHRAVNVHHRAYAPSMSRR